MLIYKWYNIIYQSYMLYILWVHYKATQDVWQYSWLKTAGDISLTLESLKYSCCPLDNSLPWLSEIENLPLLFVLFWDILSVEAVPLVALGVLTEACSSVAVARLLFLLI